jgi:pyruvate kinase
MRDKGPFVVRAVKVLDVILRRMQAHREKKVSLLRPLRVSGFGGAGTGDEMEEPS